MSQRGTCGWRHEEGAQGCHTGTPGRSDVTWRSQVDFGRQPGGAELWKHIQIELWLSHLMAVASQSPHPFSVLMDKMGTATSTTLLRRGQTTDREHPAHRGDQQRLLPLSSRQTGSHCGPVTRGHTEEGRDLRSPRKEGRVHVGGAERSSVNPGTEAGRMCWGN